MNRMRAMPNFIQLDDRTASGGQPGEEQLRDAARQGYSAAELPPASGGTDPSA